MIPPSPFAPLAHGGDLAVARRLFPGAPEPFLDLSTGINPHPYPIPALQPEKFARLPEGKGLARLARCAAAFYGTPSESNVVSAPGTQILMALVGALGKPGHAAILGPTYAEHARAVAAAGYEVTTTSRLDDLGGADLAIVVNPNNPDGRIVSREDLHRLAAGLRRNGGTLVVDEAFMEVGPHEESLAPHVEGTNVIVLRSFGKFFGLAGLRLGFALAAAETAARLRAGLGPWPVSGPAIAIGGQALCDRDWVEHTRQSLNRAAQRLDAVLTRAGLEPVGGTPLFRLMRSPAAPGLFERLGRAGIFARRFDEERTWLRFGVPGNEQDWQRLEAALRP